MRACQIMTSEVITVGADASVVEAIKMMIDNQVSGLPVVDPAGHLIGIISQGDFIRRAEIGTQRKRARWLAFLTGPRQAALDFSREHGRKVADIMTANPVTITEDAPLEQIVQIMESKNVKRVPVMRGDRLVGMVTRADFLPALVELARDVPGVPEGDEHIRKAVIAAIATAAWRPCKLKVRVRDGMVSLSGLVRGDAARRATIIAAENVPGVKRVEDDMCEARLHPAPEQDLGGGDFVSLQEQPSTVDDEPL
jgi:CBS domain-containing protein